MNKLPSIPLKLIPFTLCLLLCLLSNQAGAGLQGWDPNGTTSIGGSGTWDATTPLWTPAGTQTQVDSLSLLPWTPGNAALFCAGPSSGVNQGTFTITVSGTQIIGGIFNGWLNPGPCTLTITGGELNLADLGSVGDSCAFASYNTTTTILTPITGIGPMECQGTGGALQLYGTNSYTGGTRLNGGFAYFTNSYAFGTGPIIPVLVNSPGYAPLLSAGGAPITLTNAFSITTANAGINFASGASTPVTCSGPFDLQQNFFLRNNGNSTAPLTISGVMSGPGGLNVSANNSGTIILSGANTYEGPTSIGLSSESSGVTLSVSSINSVGTSTPSSLGSPPDSTAGVLSMGAGIQTGTLLYTGSGETTDRIVDMPGTSGGATIEADGTGALGFSTPSFQASGVGSKTLTLQGTNTAANTISGTIIDNSTTGSTVTTASFASAKTTITLASVDGITTGAAISGTGIPAGDTVKSINTGTKVVTLNTATTGAGTAGETITVAGLVNITSVTKAQAGKWILLGVNTYSGSTTVSGGTLVQGAANVIPYGTGKGNFASSAGAAFDLNGIDCQLNGFGTSGGNIDNTAATACTLTVGNNNAGGTHNGLIKNTTGTLSVVKVGTGGITFNGANTYSGTTTIIDGTLAITNDSGLGAAPNSFVADQLTLDNNINNGANGYGLRVQGGNFSLALTRGITLTANGGSINMANGYTLTVPGAITGPGAFWASPNSSAGYGTIMLSGANTYSGGTFIGTGALKLGANGALPSGTPLTIGWTFQGAANNTTFDMNGHSQTIGPLASNPGYGQAGKGLPMVKLTGALDIIQSQNTIYNGLISGSGGSLTLDAASTGTLALSGTNDTYTGPTIVNGGTLEFDVAAAVSPQTSFILSPTAGTVNLAYSGSAPVQLLSFDGGATYAAAGTWGRQNSGAQHESTRLTGDGILAVQLTASKANTLVGITPSGSGSFNLNFQGTYQAQYYLIYQTNLSEPLANWMPVPGSTNVVTDPSGLMSFPVSLPAPAFYRSVAINPAP